VITLSSTHDYVVLFAIAALFGAIGGLTYELLQTRSRETGAVELPWRQQGWRYIHLGVISSVILGAVAAIAISYFFTPEVQVTEKVNGVALIKTKWQIVKVIPLSLIVGSAGGAFLEAMRSRVLAELNQKKADTAKAVGKAGLDGVGKVFNAATKGNVANSRGKIVTGTAGVVADVAAEMPSGMKLNVLRLAEGAPRHAELAKFLDNAPDAAPLRDHLARVSSTIDEAAAQSAQSTADIIDSSVQAAKAAIDAV
jgi:hypothetical protein